MTREIELDLLDYCQQGFLVGPDSAIAHCPTGKRFTTFRTLATAEGEIGSDYTTLLEAEKIFKQAFDEYKAANPGNTLYWRIRPKVETHEVIYQMQKSVERGTRYSIYARLCIDQPKE